jgi:D-glycero-alpha-D-manno-heptose-7-phosphate kinase
LIITRTPYRISFFGGGTDYPSWYGENGGATFSTSFDKYCYISIRNLPPFFDHKYRVSYSQIEHTSLLDDIRHPTVRNVLKFKNVTLGVEVHHNGDLPAMSGIGSSSSFAVGMLNAASALNGKMCHKKQLADEAIYVEQVLNGETVGCQDQIAASFGGLNKITYQPDGFYTVQPVILDREKLELFERHCVLIFTGFSRVASTIAADQVKNIPNKSSELRAIYGLVDESINCLTSVSDPFLEFGRMLRDGWEIKKALNPNITSMGIDAIYQKALSIGAYGGKLLGAGGGGFLLIFAPPQLQQSLKKALQPLTFVPIRFEKSGSTVVLYEPANF